MRRAALASVLLLAACDCGGGVGDDSSPIGDDLAITPGIVDFGRVTLGRSARVVLDVANPGFDVVRIRRARVNEALAPEIRVDAVPAALLSNDVSKVDVVFEPRTVGAREGALIFELEAGNEVRVPIVATVVDPSLVVRPDSVDFGRVVLGEIASATVTITNEGTGPVKIAALTLDENTPSEFVVRLEASQSLDTGESFDFVIHYVPGDQSEDEGRIVIADDADRPERISVAVRGEGIASELSIEPTMLSFFGALVGETTHSELEVRNVGDETHQITDIFVEGEAEIAAQFTWDDVAFRLPISIGAGEIVRVPIGFTPRSSGPVAATLVIDGTALIQPARVTLEGQAAASPTPVATVRPDPVDFGTVPTDHDTPVRVTIGNAGARAFSVEGVPAIDPSDAPFEIAAWPNSDLVVAGQEQVRFDVVAHPASPGRHEAEIVFRTTVADSTEVRVPLRAVARTAATPVILVESDALTFGRVERGVEVEQRLDVRSVGDTTLALTDARVVPDDLFTVAPLETNSLPPGTRTPVRVRFSDPLGFAGTSSATLFITTNDPDGDVVVPLSAVTVAPSSRPPELALTLTWTPPAADLDLHLVRRGGVPFDIPSDCCFCNPAPQWSLAGASTEDPLLLAETADGTTGETILLMSAADSLYSVYVHARGVDAVARLEILSDGVVVAVEERTMLADHLWSVGDLNAIASPDVSFTLDEVVVPLVEERRDRCF